MKFIFIDFSNIPSFVGWEDNAKLALNNTPHTHMAHPLENIALGSPRHRQLQSVHGINLKRSPQVSVELDLILNYFHFNNF